MAGGAGLPVGEVVPEVDCTLGDDNEIQVSGETVLKGYLDGIGDDENKIREGDESETVWHRTGDAGYFDVYGRLWLLGRVNQAINDDRGTLHPFCVECVLDAQFGIRGAILAIDGERVVVIAKGSANPDDVLQALKHQHIDRVATVKKIPMDKRHDAKIDYPKLLELLKM
ncbi:MAG: AMP-binding protein [Oscillospiraceae bacterium]|nr:AMP-binding protein [Oscillospiraceae bacterium]